MFFEQEDLITLYKKLSYIREELRAYTIPGDVDVPSIEDLHAVISRMYNIPIDKYDVIHPANFLQSMLLRFTNRAIILVRADLSLPVKRFATVKELCHIALDEPEDWSIAGANTVEGLINTFRLEITSNGHHSPQDRVVLVENLATVAAIEILYPVAWQKEDQAALANDHTTFSKLAIKRSLPAKIITTAHHPTNRATCEMFRQI